MEATAIVSAGFDRLARGHNHASTDGQLPVCFLS
jgi:hypothetical protein